MKYSYRTSGTCSSQIDLEVEVKGMKVEEVISRLEGIRCGYKPTSCPDQLCQALKTLKA